MSEIKIGSIVAQNVPWRSSLNGRLGIVTKLVNGKSEHRLLVLWNGLTYVDPVPVRNVIFVRHSIGDPRSEPANTVED
jgi:hypothetical protein